MDKSKRNDNFDGQADRGMHRSEDDLGYLDQDRPDDMTIAPDSMVSGESANANTATMQAEAKAQQDQTTSQDKRSNQSGR